MRDLLRGAVDLLPRPESVGDIVEDADTLLGNVCPNCGGGFVSRPIRPVTNWKGDNFLGKDPASTQIRHRPVDLRQHARFAASIGLISPDKR